MSSELRQAFRKYAGAVAGALGASNRGPLLLRTEGESAVQVERGVVYARAVGAAPDINLVAADVERLARLGGVEALPRVAVVDGSGHHRPVYRPLLVYAWLQAFGLLYEVLPRAEFGRWEEALRGWCDLLEGELGATRIAEGGTPASRSDVATEA